MTELSDGRELNNTTATTVQADADYDVGSEQVISETTDQTSRRNDKLSRLPSRNIPSTSPDPQLPSRSHHASPRCIGRYQHSDPIPYLKMCIGHCGPASLPDSWPAWTQSRLLDEQGWRKRPILRNLCDFIWQSLICLLVFTNIYIIYFLL